MATRAILDNVISEMEARLSDRPDSLLLSSWVAQLKAIRPFVIEHASPEEFAAWLKNNSPIPQEK